jgi:hypothetical protein
MNRAQTVDVPRNKFHGMNLNFYREGDNLGPCENLTKTSVRF